MDNKFECEYDTFTEADRDFLRQLNVNEVKPFIQTSVTVADGLELVGIRYKNECWTLSGNPHFPKDLTFDVRKIKDAMADPQSEVTVVRLPLTEWLYQKTLPNCDEPVIVGCTPERMEKLGIIILLPDNTICMIDGNHRLCARYRAGKLDMRVAIIDFPQIEEATFIPGSLNEERTSS